LQASRDGGENRMIAIYQNAKNECGYNATRFLQMVAAKDGLTVAKNYIQKSQPTAGFAQPFCLPTSTKFHMLKMVFSSNILLPRLVRGLIISFLNLNENMYLQIVHTM
jgi:hypothetical protein